MSESRPSTAEAWWLAARPRTLPLAAAPVAVAAAVAQATGGFRMGPALAALLGALLLQIGANFANDVYDAEKGADDENRIGPPRATQLGWLSAAAVKRGMWQWQWQWQWQQQRQWQRQWQWQRGLLRIHGV